MRVFRSGVLVLGLFAIAGQLPARDRDDERERGRGAGRVTFYEHAGFRGGSVTVHAGDKLEDLTQVSFTSGGWANDRISSVRIEGGAEVLVYRDVQGRGEVLRLERSVADLGDFELGWNDAISSLRVQREREARRPQGDRPDVARIDRLIRQSYREVLRREPDEAGLRSYRRLMIEDRWTESQLRDALRQGDEYRGVVDRIVTKAYRDLLGREPDASGRQSFTEHMLRGWSEEDVRKAIRQSDEFRARRNPGGG
ncbi:MAG TPA: DUF4214 domain-containing protein [Opitutus sp.]|nr:DUF4214 domain-containing protein [Opitutus sp.]